MLVGPDPGLVSVTVVVGFALSVVAVSVAVVVGASVSPPVTVATAAAVVPASTVVAPWLASASLMELIKATAALNSSVAAAILFVCVATTSAAFDEAEVFLVSSSSTSSWEQAGSKLFAKLPSCQDGDNRNGLGWVVRGVIGAIQCVCDVIHCSLQIT